MISVNRMSSLVVKIKPNFTTSETGRLKFTVATTPDNLAGGDTLIDKPLNTTPDNQEDGYFRIILDPADTNHPVGQYFYAVRYEEGAASNPTKVNSLPVNNFEVCPQIV